MYDLDVRLSALFHAAFPGMSEQDVHNATRDSVGQWDSIGAMTLVTLIEEEFGTQFDLDEAAEWASYQQIRKDLENRLHG